MGEDRNSSDDGQRLLDKNDKQHKIHLLSVIGEVEGHETLSANTKTTKYEHVLPKLAEIEDSADLFSALYSCLILPIFSDIFFRTGPHLSCECIKYRSL